QGDSDSFSEHGQHKRGLGRPPLVERGLAYASPVGDGFHREITDRTLLQQLINGIQNCRMRLGCFNGRAATAGRNRTFSRHALSLTERKEKSFDDLEFIFNNTKRSVDIIECLNPAVGSVINGDFMKILVTGGTGK